MNDSRYDLLISPKGRRIAFDDSPVWMVNLPAMLRCAALLLLLAVAVTFASTHYPQQPAVLSWLFASLLVWFLARLAWQVIGTACTRLVIDEERLTWREGILTRRVMSVELYRIQNVELVMSWWERLAGFGTLIIESSDAAYPVWTLPGIAQAEPLREALIRYSIALREKKGIREFNMGQV